MISFPKVSPPKSYMHLSSPPCMPHAPPSLNDVQRSDIKILIMETDSVPGTLVYLKRLTWVSFERILLNSVAFKASRSMHKKLYCLLLRNIMSFTSYPYHLRSVSCKLMLKILSFQLWNSDFSFINKFLVDFWQFSKFTHIS